MNKIKGSICITILILSIFSNVFVAWDVVAVAKVVEDGINKDNQTEGIGTVNVLTDENITSYSVGDTVNSGNTNNVENSDSIRPCLKNQTLYAIWPK